MAVIFLLTAALGGVFIACLLLFWRITSRSAVSRSATILVLGDIGRSPRMMYHADSFVRNGYKVHIVAYTDTPPIASLVKSPKVIIRPIANPPARLLRLPWIARAPIRVAWQIASVLVILCWNIEGWTEWMVVQNPPSIPTLPIVQLVRWLSGAKGVKVVLDWHNTGWSILALRTGERSPLCRLAKWLEKTFGRDAFAHLFVTEALKEYLVEEWSLRGRHVVLHDRPPPRFRRSTASEHEDLFQRLVPTLAPSVPSTFIPPKWSDKGTRSAILVSSTSWTADEDFTPLLDALRAYHLASTSNPSLPRLLVLITGKGGLRAAFEELIAQHDQEWTKICVRCVFLSAADYPTLLGCADLGLSMHSSSSGRDLPMKVVDMFGCGVPVLARGFRAIGELVKDGENGKVWTTGTELGEQMLSLLDRFPHNEDLQKLTQYFDRSTEDRQGEWSNWDENWDRVMLEDILAG